MSYQEQLKTCKPFHYAALSNEDLSAEAEAHMKGYEERGCYSAHSDTAEYAAYIAMRRRLIITWMLSYGLRTKYVRAIAKAANTTTARCHIFFKREMDRAWLHYQDAGKGVAHNRKESD